MLRTGRVEISLLHMSTAAFDPSKLGQARLARLTPDHVLDTLSPNKFYDSFSPHHKTNCVRTSHLLWQCLS